MKPKNSTKISYFGSKISPFKIRCKAATLCQAEPSRNVSDKENDKFDTLPTAKTATNLKLSYSCSAVELTLGKQNGKLIERPARKSSKSFSAVRRMNSSISTLTGQNIRKKSSSSLRTVVVDSNSDSQSSVIKTNNVLSGPSSKMLIRHESVVSKCSTSCEKKLKVGQNKRSLKFLVVSSSFQLLKKAILF